MSVVESVQIGVKQSAETDPVGFTGFQPLWRGVFRSCGLCISGASKKNLSPVTRGEGSYSGNVFSCRRRPRQERMPSS